MTRGEIGLKDALASSRPAWWLITGLAFTAGSLLATDQLTLTVVIGTLYFLIPYNLLRFGINDMFDYESDSRNRSKGNLLHGPVLAGLKRESLRRWILISNVPFLIYFLAVGNLESIVLLIMMLYMAFAYSVPGLRYKEIPLIDSLTAGFQTTSPFLLGLLLYSSTNLHAPAFAAFYFWAVAAHAFSAVRDIKPDREAGYTTVAVYLGAGKTLVIAMIAYLLAVIAPVFDFGLKGLIALAFIAPYFLTVLATYSWRDDPQAPHFGRAWNRFLLLNQIVAVAGAVTVIYLYN